MIIIDKRKCKLCGDDIVKYKTHSAPKYCVKHQSQVRRYRTKLAAITLLGGKCVECGYDKDIEVLDFHHKEGIKEFNIGGIVNKSWEKLKPEILKCELLCSNCHRMRHRTDKDQNFLDAVFEYAYNKNPQCIKEIQDLLAEVAQSGRARE